MTNKKLCCLMREQTFNPSTVVVERYVVTTNGDTSPVLNLLGRVAGAAASR